MVTPIPTTPEAHELPVPLKEPLAEPLVESESQLKLEPETSTILEEPIAPLSELASVDRLQITRRLHMNDTMSLEGKRNRFFVRTPDKNLVYKVEEENKWWVGYVLYGLRPFQLRVCSSSGQEVMRIVRPFAFTTRLLPFQLQRLKVFSPLEQLIGTVEQKWTVYKPQYLVRDPGGNEIFYVQGPWMTLSCFNEVVFQIQRPNGEVVGAICKGWEGVMHALFLAPITTKFGVEFDLNLRVEEKALLLATALLLDYMHYDTY